MAGIIRYRSLSVLASVLGQYVPELAGRIHSGQASRSHRLSYPCGSIIPARFRFTPYQQAPHLDQVGDEVETSTTAVYRVGVFDATVQLRLGASSAGERLRYEDLIINAFLSQERRPGILLVRLAEVWDAVISFMLDEDEWENEAIFGEEWESTLTLTMGMPALVERGAQYTIDEIRIAMTEDLDSDIETLTASDYEVIAVDELGNVTQSSLTP